MKLKLTLFSLLIFSLCFGQLPYKPDASEIYNNLKKLQFLGSVLYIAAHPDDENTRLITHLVNTYHAQVTYLSLTRGDGGQNLIGPELRNLLGVIRTYELLEARQIDRGKQLFTRAVDFGYSKHPDETFAIWEKDKVLGDVVLAIRRVQPDIVINRFDHRSPGRTHGHHTASAMLSIEAFDLAADENKYPEHLEYYPKWQPKRLFFNTSWWFYGSKEKFKEADKTNLFAVETGKFYPSYGLSDGEIAALSRSKHQSQGFGNTGSRGTDYEYLELLKGNMPAQTLFDGIDTSWNRLEGGAAIGDILEQAENEFDFTNPAASIPLLLEAYQLIQGLPDSQWKNSKIIDIQEVIAQCSGLFSEVIASSQNSCPGETIEIKTEIINRSDTPILLKGIQFQKNYIKTKTENLINNQKKTYTHSIRFNKNTPYTSPYWLQKEGTAGLHAVSDVPHIGLAEIPNLFPVTFDLEIEGVAFSLERNLVYKFNSPVLGEVYQPFQVLPEVTGRFNEKVVLFTDDSPQKLKVSLRAGKENVSGTVSLSAPEGWSVSAPQTFNISKKGEEKIITFSVKPPKNNSSGEIRLLINNGEHTHGYETTTIDYSHIPFRNILLPATTRVSRIDLQKKGNNIGYIAGAGDAIPEALRQTGYVVTEILPEEISENRLQNLDAVVLGIRAYNTQAELEQKQSILFNYVKNGGNVIVQYNTSRELLFENPAPYSINLSRLRVTDENAPVDFINPNHKVLNFPNKITKNDFEDWVQERGLYFADTWDDAFEAVLQMNDPGEEPLQGSLLIAPYGKGYFTYTGLSFFRQLPEGVPGAYRLFANLLSLNKE